MCEPSRYTNSMAIVNNTRLRRSGTRKILASFSNISALLCLLVVLDLLRDKAGDHLGFAARLGQLFFGGLGETVRLHRQGRLQLAIAQHLDLIVLAHQPLLYQQCRRDRALPQLHQPFQVQDGVFHAENIGEAALGQAAVQGHLAAFKAAHHARSGAGPLSLMSARGGLAHAAAHAPAHALAVGGCPFWRRQVGKIRWHVKSLSRFKSGGYANYFTSRNKWGALAIMPRMEGVSSRSTIWLRRVKPSPFTTSFCFFGAQILERTYWMRIIFFSPVLASPVF